MVGLNFDLKYDPFFSCLYARMPLACHAYEQEEKRRFQFKSKFNPTIQPSNLKFNYLRKKMRKIPAQNSLFRLDGWMVGLYSQKSHPLV